MDWLTHELGRVGLGRVTQNGPMDNSATDGAVWRRDAAAER